MNVPEQLYEHSPHDVALAKEHGVDLPELPRTETDQVGKFLVLYFAEDHYLMQPPLCELVKIPQSTVKSLDDALASVNLTGQAFGRTYTCYNIDKYKIPLPEGVAVSIR